MIPCEDEISPLLAGLDISALLNSAKSEYSGVARLGIEALELKIMGYSGADIAKLYGVKQNHVGAWISRAAAKLRKNGAVLKSLG